MAIIFDLDGTLLYTLEDLSNALNHSLEMFGYNKVSLEDTRRFIGNGIRNLIYTAAKDDSKLDLMFEEFKRYYEPHCMDKTLPYVGIIKLIYDLKEEGHTLVCISNKHHITLNKLVDHFFSGMFSLVLGDGMGYKRKPDKDIIYACANLLNKEINDFIYIGDSDIDAKTIINSGIKGILVSYGYRDKELLKSFNLPIVDNVYELKEMINKLK